MPADRTQIRFDAASLTLILGTTAYASAVTVSLTDIDIRTDLSPIQPNTSATVRADAVVVALIDEHIVSLVHASRSLVPTEQDGRSHRVELGSVRGTSVVIEQQRQQPNLTTDVSKLCRCKAC